MDKAKYLDYIKGSMFGGAVGDALGYPVEFWYEERIQKHYPNGKIDKYDLDYEEGIALISDDTQMSLYTANGLLVGDTCAHMDGSTADPRTYVLNAYLDWYKTQTMGYEGYFNKEDKSPHSWLMEVPELWSRRAPGNTCMSALRKRQYHPSENFIESSLNTSKGCGGIMRIAPVAFRYNIDDDILKMDREAAQIAAITHGHPLGYLSAAAMAHILHRLVYYRDVFSLETAIRDAEELLPAVFGDSADSGSWLEALKAVMEDAINKSLNGLSDLENIRSLGQGWVAEETLSIALYCALRHGNDFSSGVIAAVNHSGDSDSTGAVAGNLLGAMCGYDAIEDKWKHNLELSSVILEIAEDLCNGCPCQIEANSDHDAEWMQKYIKMHRKSARPFIRGVN